MGRAHEKWHICKCLIFHAKNLLKVYNQKNSGYAKSRRKIRQQKIPKIDSKFLHIELLSREAWTSKDTRFLTLSGNHHADKPQHQTGDIDNPHTNPDEQGQRQNHRSH